MKMTTTDEQQAAEAVAKARGEFDRLLQIKTLLKTELPAARAALFSAEKRLRHLTAPDKPAIRRAEIDSLRAKITAAKQTEVLANG